MGRLFSIFALASGVVALATAFWLQLDAAPTAAVSVGILALQTHGQMFQKSGYRRTLPTSGKYTLATVCGKTYTGENFAFTQRTLITGFVFVTNLFTQNLVQKTVLSLIAWLIFSVLLIGRMRFGWRGRSAVRWTLSGFGILAVAYFGVKFVLEYLFGRHWG